MTQKEKELLLKDLCSGLKNGIICSIYREDDEGFGWRDAECKGYFQTNHSYEFYFEDVIAIDNIENIKPYLRPMSSMTEEEREELSRLTDDKFKFYLYTAKPEIVCYEKYNYLEGLKVLDWLNAHHFDYRGLIGKDLALEAPEGMYS